MRSYPHKPEVGKLVHVKKRVAGARTSLLSRGQPADASLAAEQDLLLAAIAYAEEMPASTVIDLVRQALDHFHEALQAGYHPSPREMHDYLLSALAIDVTSAHFIASVPEQLWEQLDNFALYPVMVQVKALIALLHYNAAEAERWVAVSHAMAFEQRLEYATHFLHEIENFHGFLDALHKCDASTFNAALKVRMEIRAASFSRNGRNSPLGFLDLHGLGLCALARDRGMTVMVRHVYLPLELLDAAAKQPRDEAIDRN